MTAKAKMGKRKQQKAGLNKSILDVGMGVVTEKINVFTDDWRVLSVGSKKNTYF